jgi:hypothetical protein
VQWVSKVMEKREAIALTQPQLPPVAAIA